LCQALFDEAVGDGVAEDFTPGCLWWVESEVRVCGWELIHEGLVGGVGGAHFAVLIVLLLAVGEVADGGIDEDIARAGVEVVEVRVEITIVVRVGRGKADVGNAADVLAGAELGGVM
jgi:hypothetical protein